MRDPTTKNNRCTLLPDLLPNSVARAGTSADDDLVIAQKPRHSGTYRDKRKLIEMGWIEFRVRCFQPLSHLSGARNGPNKDPEWTGAM
jgi:hypothetical protein